MLNAKGPLLVRLTECIGEILKEIYPAFLLQPNSSTERFAKLVTLLEPQSQKRVFDCILHDLEETYLPSSIVSAASLDHIEVNRTIRGVSSVVATTLDVLPTLSQHLIDCLVKGVGVGIRGISMRRALTTIFGHQKGAVPQS